MQSQQQNKQIPHSVTEIPLTGHAFTSWKPKILGPFGQSNFQRREKIRQPLTKIASGDFHCWSPRRRGATVSQLGKSQSICGYREQNNILSSNASGRHLVRSISCEMFHLICTSSFTVTNRGLFLTEATTWLPHREPRGQKGQRG